MSWSILHRRQNSIPRLLLTKPFKKQINNSTNKTVNKLYEPYKLTLINGRTKSVITGVNID